LFSNVYFRPFFNCILIYNITASLAIQLFLSLSLSLKIFFFQSKLTRDFILYISHSFIFEVLTFKLSVSRPRRRIKLLQYFNLTYTPIGMPCNVCNTFSYRNHGGRVIDFYLIYYSETCQNALYYLFKENIIIIIIIITILSSSI